VSNVKPGDVARVTRDDYGNVGAIVLVEEEQNYICQYGMVWQCVALQPLRGTETGAREDACSFAPGERVDYPDAWLRRVDPPEDASFLGDLVRESLHA